MPQYHSSSGMNVEKQKTRASKMHKIAQDDKKTCIDCRRALPTRSRKGMKEDDDDE